MGLLMLELIDGATAGAAIAHADKTSLPLTHLLPHL